MRVEIRCYEGKKVWLRPGGATADNYFVMRKWPIWISIVKGWSEYSICIPGRGWKFIIAPGVNTVNALHATINSWWQNLVEATYALGRIYYSQPNRWATNIHEPYYLRRKNATPRRKPYCLLGRQRTDFRNAKLSQQNLLQLETRKRVACVVSPQIM